MARPAFVLHDHRKPRPHFDLRLEEDGVLRSWAVPRGLPDDPGGNRLAVAVPIADTGWWELQDRNDKRIVFTLHGRDGAHRYALIHTDGSNWLLHRTKDQPQN
jgi:hypothetical protein